MTNYEKYKDKIEGILEYDDCGIAVVYDKPVACDSVRHCEDCQFFGIENCNLQAIRWSAQEYEPKSVAEQCTELDIILDKHKKWLFREEGGERADLREANLRETNLCGADLYGADLYGADLYGADLREANLRETNLCGADLYGADLYGADLRGADLRGADLYGANLREANLYGADLRGASFYGANLYGANLREANLYGADLRGASFYGANLRGASFYGAKNIPDYVCPINCPQEGAFIGFKKANTENEKVIVKLKITEDAKRSSATTRKCRCDKAEVISITSFDEERKYKKAYSKHDPTFMYKVGEIVSVDDFDDDRWNECSTGIHFFITREEAINY